jgi:hypothetical protein
MNKIKTLEIVIITIALFIVISEGVTPNFFTVWNLLPILVYYFLLKKGLPFWKNIIIKITLFLTGITLLLFPVIIHLMWAFDFGETKTGSSTSALVFIFIPVWALLFAFLPITVQLIYISKLKNKSLN